MDLKELRKYCIDNHRKMWNWLAENPKKGKKDWPGWEHHNDDVFNKKEEDHCFLCGYVSAEPDKGCSHCLLDWVVTYKCSDNDSYFEKYHCDFLTLEDRAKYAEIIANLPEKDDAK